MNKNIICRIFGHKIDIVSYLPIIFVGIKEPHKYAGTAGYCQRCKYEWDDTTDAIKALPNNGNARQIRYYIFGRA